jgi:hypothetical protein
VAVYLRCNLWDLLMSNSPAMAAVTTARLANGISDAKAERTTEQKRNHNIRHAIRHITSDETTLSRLRRPIVFALRCNAVTLNRRRPFLDATF